MENHKSLEVSAGTVILDVMKRIEAQALKFVIVVDDQGVLLGTVTDGDVRRGILNGVPLADSVEKIMNRNPLVFMDGENPAGKIEEAKRRRISFLPVIDRGRKVVGINTISELSAVPIEKPNAVVIMAGGLGSRLGELTTHTPKPMLEVGQRPVLEIILENLKAHGFRKFHISVNYKSELIESHFGSGEKHGVSIRYLRETKRLGTAGALSLLRDAGPDPIVVTNADVLTKVDFTSMLQNHLKRGNCASMGVRQYDFQVPYGVVYTQQDRIEKIEEKPVSSFFVNAGVYVLNPEVPARIPHDTHYDMPRLFQDLIAESMNVGVFPIHEYWLDIGQKDDLLKAQKEYKEIFEP